MTERGPTPHDALFRHVFTQPEHAAAELRHVLPVSIAAAIDWTTLRVVPGSWVDEELRDSHADVLCSARLAGRETLIYTLLEHKSRAQRMTPLQLLRYMVRIWQSFTAQHENTHVLPPILPVVIYHGSSSWTAPTDLLHLFDLPPDLRDEIAPLVPNFRFVLDNLTVVSEASLRARAMAALPRLALFCLQRIREGGDLRAALTRWADNMRAVFAAPSGADRLAAILSYIMQVSELPDDELREFVQTQLDPEAEATMTSTWEQIKEKGRVEGQAEMLIRQLEARFGELSAEHRNIVRGGSSDQLIEWATRIFDAGSLDDVFGAS